MEWKGLVHYIKIFLGALIIIFAFIIYGTKDTKRIIKIVKKDIKEGGTE